MPTSHEVFGIQNNKNPLSHVQRENVDKKLVRALRERRKTVIALHGPSKQGKTSLLRATLPRGSYLQITGARGITPKAIYKDLLNQCNAVVAKERHSQVNADVEADLVWVKVKLGGARAAENSVISADLGNPNSVARVLCRCTDLRTIVVENFHFFDTAVQEHLATAMRTFEDIYDPAIELENNSFTFVVLGTWNSEDYLQGMANLDGRVEDIAVDPWSRDDLEHVLNAGAPHLNVLFHPEVTKRLITYSHGNVGLLQELTLETLLKHNVPETARTAKNVDQYRLVDQVAHETMRKGVDAVVGYVRTIADCGNPFVQGKTRSYYILKAFLSGDQATIEQGFPITELLKKTNALIQSTDKKAEPLTSQTFNLLVKKQWLEYQLEKIKSPIIAYDARRDLLSVLDGWTKLVLKLNRFKIADAF